MKPTWYIVDRDYTPLAEIKFREDQIKALPAVIQIDDVEYALDPSGGFYQREPASDPPDP